MSKFQFDRYTAQGTFLSRNIVNAPDRKSAKTKSEQMVGNSSDYIVVKGMGKVKK